MSESAVDLIRKTCEELIAKAADRQYATFTLEFEKADCEIVEVRESVVKKHRPQKLRVVGKTA